MPNREVPEDVIDIPHYYPERLPKTGTSKVGQYGDDFYRFEFFAAVGGIIVESPGMAGSAHYTREAVDALGDGDWRRGMQVVAAAFINTPRAELAQFSRVPPLVRELKEMGVPGYAELNLGNRQ